jgi:hypothetical protein
VYKIIQIEGGHTILIVKGLFHRYIFFDSSPMYFHGTESFVPSTDTALRFSAVTTENIEDVHKWGVDKVTYCLLVTDRFFRESIYRVEKFQGGSMLQWHDEIGELIYSSK